MSIYTVRGLTAATAATANNAAFGIWNPDTAKRIKLLEFGIFCVSAPAAGAGLLLGRNTTKGTSTDVTPDADNAWDADDVPASLFVLQTAFSAEATKATPEMWGWVPAGAIGAGVIWPVPRGIYIPPASGLTWKNRVATIFPACEVYATIEE